MGNPVIDKKLKLLITEDDFENQRLIELYFKRYFDITTCSSSDQFYNLIGKKKFDFILMDISIKGDKNGLELTKELKENPEYANIPVLCYTAHALHKDRINALEAGCDAYLSKPTDLKTLLNSIVDLLKLKGIPFNFEPPMQSYSFS